MKSERNKTIDITIEEGQEYLDKCVKLDCKTELSQILDKTIIGDTFEILKLLPEKSIDLLITDPPYNLNKDFHGNKFKRMSEKDYLDYIEKWVCLVKPLLKDNASIYVCCD